MDFAPFQDDAMARKTPPVDPALEQQLSAAGDDDAVEATFSLHPPSEGSPLVDPAEVRTQVARLIKSAEEATGQKVHDLNVLPRIQSFVLSAPPKVMRAVLRCAEVASALANKQPESMAIEPVTGSGKKPPPRRGGKPKKGAD